jgi:hypothetical protein
MVIGVTMFVAMREPVRIGAIVLPGFIDPLMIALLTAITALVAVARWIEPTAAEASYFRQIKSISPSSTTIAAILAKPNALSELKREYQQVPWVMAVLVVPALGIYGFLTIKLALSGA